MVGVGAETDIASHEQLWEDLSKFLNSQDSRVVRGICRCASGILCVCVCVQVVDTWKEERDVCVHVQIVGTRKEERDVCRKEL